MENENQQKNQENSLNSDPPGEERFYRGMYKGRLIKDIFKINPGYVRWAVKIGLIILPKYLKL